MKKMSLSARLVLAGGIGVAGIGVVGAVTGSAQAVTCSSTTPVSVVNGAPFQGVQACAHVAGNEVETSDAADDAGGYYTDTGTYTCINGGCTDVGAGVSNFTGPRYAVSGTNATVDAGGTDTVLVRVNGQNTSVPEPVGVCVTAGTGGASVSLVNCMTGAPITQIPYAG